MPDTQYPDWNKLLRDAIREFPAPEKEIDKAIWKAFVWTVFVRLFLLVVKKGERP